MTIIVVVFGLLLTVTIFFMDYNKKNYNNVEENVFNQEVKIENNILPFPTEEAIISDNTLELKKLIEDYLSNEIDKVGIYYFDIKKEQYFEINSDLPYFPASVSKLYTVIALYDLAFENEINISDEIYYIKSDYEAGSGVLQGMNLSKPYTLAKLAEYAIINSDNIAFHMLYRTITRDKVLKNYESIISHTATKSSNGTLNMSAKDAYLIMKKVYYNENNNKYYKDFLKHLQNTTSTGKIREYLPHVVARKGGDYQDYSHDATIVFADNPYILTIFSKGLSNADEKISQIAKIIDENR